MEAACVSTPKPYATPPEVMLLITVFDTLGCSCLSEKESMSLARSPQGKDSNRTHPQVTILAAFFQPQTNLLAAL